MNRKSSLLLGALISDVYKTKPTAMQEASRGRQTSEASLVYMISSKTARATLRDPVLETRKRETERQRNCS